MRLMDSKLRYCLEANAQKSSDIMSSSCMKEWVSFKSRGWFEDVTPSVHGHELFDLISASLRLKQTFYRIEDELSASTKYLHYLK